MRKERKTKEFENYGGFGYGEMGEKNINNLKCFSHVEHFGEDYIFRPREKIRIFYNLEKPWGERFRYQCEKCTRRD